MTLYRKTAGDAILRRQLTGKLCNTCCDVFSSSDCACFLNPNPDAWVDSTVYQIGDCVKHGLWVYYSKLADNQYNEPNPSLSTIWQPYGFSDTEPEPPLHDFEKTYTLGDCTIYGGLNKKLMGEDPPVWMTYYIGNTLTHWNSFSPYGGVGKSPSYFVVSFESNYDDLGSPAHTQSLKGKIVLTKESGLGCSYMGRGTANFTDSEDGPFIFTLCGFYNVAGGGGGTSILGYSPGCAAGDKGGFTGDVYAVIPQITAGRHCEFEKTETWNYVSGGHLWGQMSARPLDCDYVQYSTSIVYNSGACVYHAGRFWRCISSNGPGTPAGVQEPDDSSAYWEEA